MLGNYLLVPAHSDFAILNDFMDLNKSIIFGCFTQMKTYNLLGK